MRACKSFVCNGQAERFFSGIVSLNANVCLTSLLLPGLLCHHFKHVIKRTLPNQVAIRNTHPTTTASTSSNSVADHAIAVNSTVADKAKADQESVHEGIERLSSCSWIEVIGKCEKADVSAASHNNAVS